MGKALGGGVYPVSGVAANKEILSLIKKGQHGSTFGGNPLACVAGITAIEVLQEEKLIENSATQGAYFMKLLKQLEGNSKVEKVRGKGLLIGVVIKQTAGPAKDYVKKLRNEGLICKETHDKIIRFAPPLVITEDQIDWVFSKIQKILGD